MKPHTATTLAHALACSPSEITPSFLREYNRLFRLYRAACAANKPSAETLRQRINSLSLSR